MIREPLAPPGIQVVVSDPVSARRGVDETTVSGIDRYVADPTALREQHQVTDSQRSSRRINRDPGARHLP